MMELSSAIFRCFHQNIQISRKKLPIQVILIYYFTDIKSNNINANFMVFLREENGVLVSQPTLKDTEIQL